MAVMDIVTIPVRKSDCFDWKQDRLRHLPWKLRKSTSASKNNAETISQALIFNIIKACVSGLF
jgi:hypothetical protein